METGEREVGDREEGGRGREKSNGTGSGPDQVREEIDASEPVSACRMHYTHTKPLRITKSH